MSVREIIAVPLALASIFFLLLALTFPLLLHDQSRKDAHHLAELQSIQAYLDRSVSAGKPFPSDHQIRLWAEERQLDVAYSVSTAPFECLNGFVKAPQDRYVIGFWAGEWSECLSSPSGATTLEPTMSGLLKSGLWIELAVYLVLGVGSGSAAWVLGLRRRRNHG